MSRKKKVMVCVTQQRSCERLLARGSQLTNHKHDELFMVHIVKENWRYFSQMKESDAMEYLYDIAKNYDASVNVLKAKDIELALRTFAQKHEVDVIVMGESQESNEQQNMIHRIQLNLDKKIQFMVVSLDDLDYSEAISQTDDHSLVDGNASLAAFKTNGIF